MMSRIGSDVVKQQHVCDARIDVSYCSQPPPLRQCASCEAEEIVVFAGAEDPGRAYDIAPCGR